MTVSRTPAQIIGRDSIDELWGEGFTVVPRISALEFPEHIVPRGMAYQWNAKSVFGDKTIVSIGETPQGWSPVPASRHPGMFAPYGYEGNIETGGLILCERPKEDVEASRADQGKQAEKLIDDWAKKYGGDGVTGTVRVGYDESAKHQSVGEIEHIHQTKIPRELMPYISEIFAERDHLLADVYLITPEIRAKLTEQAIEKVRARLQKDPVT